MCTISYTHEQSLILHTFTISYIQHTQYNIHKVNTAKESKTFNKSHQTVLQILNLHKILPIGAPI